MKTHTITLAIAKDTALQALDDRIEELKQLPILTSEALEEVRVLAGNLNFQILDRTASRDDRSS